MPDDLSALRGNLLDDRYCKRFKRAERTIPQTDDGAIFDAIRRVRGRSGFRDHSTRREIAHPRSGVYRDETKRKPKMHLRFGSGVGSGFKISLCWRQLLLITIVCCVVRSASTAVCQSSASCSALGNLE